MTKASNKYSNINLSQLLTSYFEGTISPPELMILREMAKEYNEGLFDVDDLQMAEDLQSISAMEDYAQATLLTYESCIPEDLEKRLDEHISHLASRSRIKWKWIKSISAAACLALLFTTGVFLFSTGDTLPDSRKDNAKTALARTDTDTDTSASSPHAVLASNGFNNSNSTESYTTVVPPQVYSPITSSPTTNSGYSQPTVVASKSARAKGVMKKPSGNDIPSAINLPHSTTEMTIPAISGIVVMPEHISSTEGILPSLMASKIDIPELISSPFTTIGQTLSNMVESLNFVNATIYEANKTASALSEEFLQASAAPLRSI